MSPRGFSLVEVLIAGAVLVTLAVPMYLMLVSSTRSAALAAEEVQATLAAEEVLDGVRLLALTQFSGADGNLPSLPPWKEEVKLVSPITGDEDRWADLDEVLRREGNGFPLWPGGAFTERSRFFMGPPAQGMRRYLRIEYPGPYGDGRPDKMICRIRVLVHYEIMTGGPAQQRQLELTSLVTNEDVLATLGP